MEVLVGRPTAPSVRQSLNQFQKGVQKQDLWFAPRIKAEAAGESRQLTDEYVLSVLMLTTITWIP